MRLIDADNFLKRFEKMCETELDNVIATILRGALINEPTAYDIDKVVEELSNADPQEMMSKEQINVLNYAIEIVKQGGVYDDVCEWTQSGDMAISTHTFIKYKIKQCDGLYALSTCPYCGKKIKVVE